MSRVELPARVQTLKESGALTPGSLHFCEMLARRCPGSDDLAVFGAAIAMRAVALGHVCADLERVVSRPPVGQDGAPLEFDWPGVDEWISALRGADFVHEVTAEASTPRATPLVLRGSRLYLTRYFQYEQELAVSLLKRTAHRAEDVDKDQLEQGIRRLFPDAKTREEKQARAARAAVESRLAIISGGPGTGKTTTVARIMALIAEQQTDGQTLRIALLAPTGKAAQRLAESIAGAVDGAMNVGASVLSAIPREASTIHRALGVSAFSATTFRHNVDNPLHADVVLVDEASMIDLALMAKLVDAVPMDARLIFLGDRDQLASVEAGAIFGDICLAGQEPTARIAESTVELTHRFRFTASSPIGALAEAIKSGDGPATLTALPTRLVIPSPPPELPPAPELFDPLPIYTEPDPVVQRVSPAERGSPIAAVAEEIAQGYAELLRATKPDDALRRLTDFRVLCAHRRGRFGVENVGEAIERLLVDRQLIPRSSRFGYVTDLWYPGRPVIVTQNDYQVELFNGDVGIALADPTDPETIRVWFAGADGTPRSLQPARLPPHETCFAMTVHKSQGSEFGGVIVVLPAQPSPIGTRELLYTAVTRARRDVTVLALDEVIVDAVGRSILRSSGLRETLAGA